MLEARMVVAAAKEESKVVLDNAFLATVYIKIYQGLDHFGYLHTWLLVLGDIHERNALTCRILWIEETPIAISQRI
jgi:hypothetical protein